MSEPQSLFGMPVIFTDDLPDIGDIVLGDWRAYLEPAIAALLAAGWHVTEMRGMDEAGGCYVVIARVAEAEPTC